jgi:hypothetical protein
MYERKLLQPERDQERRWIPPYPKRENLTFLLLGKDLFPQRRAKDQGNTANHAEKNPEGKSSNDYQKEDGIVMEMNQTFHHRSGWILKSC